MQGRAHTRQAQERTAHTDGCKAPVDVRCRRRKPGEEGCRDKDTGASASRSTHLLIFLPLALEPERSKERVFPPRLARRLRRRRGRHRPRACRCRLRDRCRQRFVHGGLRWGLDHGQYRLLLLRSSCLRCLNHWMGVRCLHAARPAGLPDRTARAAGRCGQAVAPHTHAGDRRPAREAPMVPAAVAMPALVVPRGGRERGTRVARPPAARVFERA